MPKFKIKYYYDGSGIVEVEAKNEEEVREMFFSGDIDLDNILDKIEENFNIDTIERV